MTTSLSSIHNFVYPLLLFLLFLFLLPFSFFSVSHSPLVRLGATMNMADQMASARRKCKHLLIHLFKMVCFCLCCMHKLFIYSRSKVILLHLSSCMTHTSFLAQYAMPSVQIHVITSYNFVGCHYACTMYMYMYYIQCNI